MTSKIQLDEPKLNSGAWEDPLLLSTTSRITTQLHTIGKRCSDPFSINGSSHSENKNHSTPSPLNSTGSSTTSTADIINLLNGNNHSLNHNRSQLSTNKENRPRLEHTPSTHTITSEESWCSFEKNSEHDLSSDGEDEKSERSLASINIRNSQLRSTLSKAKQHLSFEKWRNHYNNNSGNNQLSGNKTMASQASQDTTSLGEPPSSRLSRWFSIRRGSTHQYEVGSKDVSDGRANSVDSAKQIQQHHQQTLRTASAGVMMPHLSETEEDSIYGFINGSKTALAAARHITPALPPVPTGLSAQQLKRRHIFAAIVHSENSYVATLHRLVNEYKKTLEESNPPILSSSKIATLFHRLPEILHCHALFRIALADCVRNWDREEKLGDVFVGSFGKPTVLEIYSGFINNFSAAMELAKMEAKRKSALADFFKVKQISAHDRLSFFGLMVKPVQRFPQFILFLQDLLKYTPQGHHDRMSLQLALTQLESLAEMLNERKREAEQYQAFKEMLGHISGTFNTRSLSSDGGNRNRYLLREDNVTQLEFNHAGFIVKSKQRRLLLINDKVICVSVAPKLSHDFGATEKLTFKWMYPVTDVEIVDNSTSATLSRILTAGLNRGGSIKSNGSSNGGDATIAATNGADNLCTEMSNLMHDYEVMSRINDLVGSLKGNYREINTDVTKKILISIQSSIQKKDEEMAWVDSCCLQLIAKNKNGKEETFTFQTENPAVKKEWITELRLAQLALDTNNSPAWDVPEHDRRPTSTKLPLFVKSQSVHKSHQQTEVRCGCYYTTTNHNRTSTRRRSRNQSYLWLCTTDGSSSHITILLQHQQRAGELKEVGSFDLSDTLVTSIEFVKGINHLDPFEDESTLTDGDVVWLGTFNRKILIYVASNPETEKQIVSCNVPAPVTQILFHLDCGFVSLSNGCIQIFRRSTFNGHWLLKEPQLVALGLSDPVTNILPINANIYAGCGQKVWVLNGYTGETQKSFEVQHVTKMGDTSHAVHLMAHSGIGLWVALKNSSVVCLYHTETFKHLQDINIASNVLRVTSSQRDNVNNNSSVFVTSLMACKGLLWVGTNIGISLTIPLPRLEGVPIIFSGGVNISYHAHFGPITFLLPLLPRSYYKPPLSEALPTTAAAQQQHHHLFEEDINENNENLSGKQNVDYEEDVVDTKEPSTKKLEKQNSLDITAKLKAQLVNSPIVIRRKRGKDLSELSRQSKTLPRGLGSAAAFCSSLHSNTSSSQGSDQGYCDVYGLYRGLIFVKEDYETESGRGNLMEPSYENLRRSDPELAAIPAKVSTLDRRLRMKISRPRSLDLSNWSVDSRSSSLYTSSGSEESMGIRQSLYSGRSVSRNSSSASHKACNNSDLTNISEIGSISNDMHVLPSSSLNNSLIQTPSKASLSTTLTSTIQARTPTTNNNNSNSKVQFHSISQREPVQTTVISSTIKKKKNAKGNTNTNDNPSGQRTVITLTGGRGYINWRHVWYSSPSDKFGKASMPASRGPNSHDAHVVMWEKKL